MTTDCNIIDTTLREGEQAPGLYFSIEQKRKIIDRLFVVGVAEIELGIASPLVDGLSQLTHYCRRHYPDLRISLWSRCLAQDIDHAAQLQPDSISLSLPASDIHLERKFGQDRSWALFRLKEGIQRSLQAGLTVSVGLEDATRAESEFLTELVLKAEHLGATRVRLADTVGIGTPKKINNLIKRLRLQLSTCELGIHAHNDFGMATANSIAAFDAGASWADATVLGLGERSGCARLEELAGYLALVLNDSGINASELKPLAQYVSTISGFHISGNRPVIGDDIFTCETGLHLNGIEKDPRTYEPYQPGRVGSERRLLYSGKSGRNALIKHLKKSGYDISGALGIGHLKKIRTLAASLQRPLTEDELVSCLH